MANFRLTGRLAMAVGVILLLIVSGCAPGAPSPTPTVAPKATAAPAATAAPTATAVPKPTEAAKPQAEVKPSPAATSASAPAKVKVGVLAAIGFAGGWLAMDKGYFKDENLEVEFVATRSGGEQIPALATGELDVGFMPLDSGFFNAIVRGIGIKIAMSSGILTKGGEKSSGVVVRKDLFDSGAIKSVADLKGKTVANTGEGDVGTITTNAILATAGLSLRDVKLTTVALPDMLAALANKAIDAAYMPEPFITTGKEQGILAPLFYAGQVRSLYDQVVYVYSEKFATGNPDAARRFAVAVLKGHRDYNEAFFGSGKGKAEAVAALAKLSPIKDPAMWAKIGLNPMKPNGEPNAKAVSEDMAWFVAQGYVRETKPADAFIDSKFVDYAADKLGRVKD